MLERILQNLGLNKKEVKIYLAALEAGSSPASKIAEISGVNRVTAYDILDSLWQKGMVSQMKRRGIKHFSATDPKFIVSDFKDKARKLEKALPALKGIMSKNIKKPFVQFYEGLDGIKKVYQDTLTASTEILNYANSKEIRDNWKDYDTEYVSIRAKKKIFLKGIAPYDDYGVQVRKDDKKYFREVRLVPEEEFKFTNEINIYDDKIAIVSYKNELVGIIIESKEITDTQRDIFKMAWIFAGMYGKTNNTPKINF